MHAAGRQVVERVAGANRFETAAALSTLSYPAGADTVVLASGADFPDALMATPLAITLGAPLLLATADRVPPATFHELRRLGARRVVLVGGQDALGRGITHFLEAAGIHVHRLGGRTRFETARVVAGAIPMNEQHREAIVAVGQRPGGGDAFPDALAAGPLAGGPGGTPRPILLTLPHRLPGATLQALDELSVDRIMVLGGPSVVLPDVEQQLRELPAVRGVERLGGRDRYETATIIAERAIAEGASADDVYLVTGLGFPEALAAGSSVGRGGGTLLLAAPGPVSTAAATHDFLARRSDDVVRLRLVGGETALPSCLADDLRALLATCRR